MPRIPRASRRCLEQYLLWMETHHYAQGTVAIRRITLSKFLRWCHERTITKAREVTREMVERYQRHLFYYRKRNGEQLAVSSQAHWLTALRSWFAWMARQRLIDADPAREMQLPREEKRLPRHALSQSEVEAVLAQADPGTPFGLRNRAILETLYSTGLRREEVLALQLGGPGPGAIDRAGASRQGEQGPLRADRARAVAWLAKYLAEARPALLGDVSTPNLFVTRTGRRMTPNQLSATVRDYLEKAGVAKAGRLPFVSPHRGDFDAGRRRGRALHPGHAGACQPGDDADLHARDDRQAPRGARANASGAALSPSGRGCRTS